MVERHLDRALSNTRGISFSEYRLLRSLSSLHAGTAMRVELADAVGLTPSAVTRALRPLEKLGYVTSRKSERDARRSLVTLTSPGIDLLADAQGAMQDAISGLSAVQLDENQLSAFCDALLGKPAGIATRRSVDEDL